MNGRSVKEGEGVGRYGEQMRVCLKGMRSCYRGRKGGRLGGVRRGRSEGGR